MLGKKTESSYAGVEPMTFQLPVRMLSDSWGEPIKIASKERADPRTYLENLSNCLLENRFI